MFSLPLFLTTLLSAYIIYKVSHLMYNLFLHPLANFPGPLPGRATDWYKTYIEVYKQQSMVHLLIDLHHEFGDVVRIAPNEVCQCSYFLMRILAYYRMEFS
jgi:hypothetical protein